jgi:hypothetical protein
MRYIILSLQFVWICVWFAVVVLGIDTGLAVGVVIALMIVLIRSSRYGPCNSKCIFFFTSIYPSFAKVPMYSLITDVFTPG